MFSRPLCGSEHPTGKQSRLTCSQSYGGHGERETPGHIPNPEAKPLSADGTAPETGWESRTPPDKLPERGSEPRALTPVRRCVRPLFGRASSARTFPDEEVLRSHDCSASRL